MADEPQTGHVALPQDKRHSLFPFPFMQRSQSPPPGKTAVGVYDDASFYVADVLKSPVHSQPVLSQLEQILGFWETTTGLVVKRGVLLTEPRIFNVPVLEKTVLAAITDTYSLFLRGNEDSGYVEIRHIAGDTSFENYQSGAVLRTSSDPLLVALFSNSWKQLQDFAPYQRYLN